MADLAALRLAVGRSRRTLDSLRRSVHDQRARLDEMRRQLVLFEGPPPNEPDFVERFDSLSEHVPILEQHLVEADEAQRASRVAYDEAAAAEPALWGGDELPLLLLPVRLEAVHETTGGAAQLLLRVYPDDVHVDAHEEGLTDNELAAGTRYWSQVGDGADEASVEGAWNDLVSRLGLARAAWTREATRPGAPEPARRRRSWNRAAETTLLPDHFEFSAYIEDEGELHLAWREPGRPIPDRLAVGFPPKQDNEESARPGDLPWDPGSRWLVSFEDAVDRGMALRVALPDPAVRYALLTAVGVMADIDGDEGARRVEAALQAHQFGQGLAFLPIGTPTNNTPATRSAWRTRPQARPPAVVDAQRAAHDPASAQAAARLARALGMDGQRVLAAAPDALDDSEDADLRRLHRAFALFFNQSPLLRPYPPPPANPDEIVVDDDQLVPDLPELVDHFTEHVRSRGALPTVRLGRQPYGVLPATSIDLWRGDELVPHLLHHLTSLLSTMEDKRNLAPRVGVGDDQDRVLLDLLSRVPSSLRMKMVNTRPVGLSQSLVDEPPNAVVGTIPEGTRAEFLLAKGLSDGESIVRDVLGPPDEATATIVASRPLAALLAALEQRIATFEEDPTVDPLVLEEPFMAAWDLVLPLVDTAVARTFHAIAAHVMGMFSATIRRKEFITLDPASATPQEQLFVPDMIVRLRQLCAAFVALEDRAVVDLPGLDRLMLEVLDTLAHRIDAWVASFANARLADVRSRHARGVHVGAYGWLTDVQDPGPLGPNDGYIMTPSMHHAATAAVLRSGFRNRDGSTALAVDLQSWRVRTALDIIDGVRSGQPLSVLLGYRFERGLHDARLDLLVEGFRAAFPLPLAVDPSMAPPPGTSRTTIEARNVVDGQCLRRGERAPGVPDPRDALDTGTREIVDRLVADLDEVVDAAGDLLLAESVHHLVGGNPLRAGLSADAIGHGDALPQEFDVVRTPRGAVGVTHHVGVLGVEGAVDGWSMDRPLAKLEPTVDRWLSHRFGSPSGWSFATVAGPAVDLGALQWCATDVLVGAVRPVVRSALGAALRAAGGDLAEAGWSRAEELAVLAEQLRSVLAGAGPLLPTHLDPANPDPWNAIDAAEVAERIAGWHASVRDARAALAAAAAIRPPVAADLRVALAALARTGLLHVGADVALDGADEAEAEVALLGHVANVLASLDADALEPLPPPPEGDAVEAWLRTATARVTGVMGDAITIAPRLDLTAPAAAGTPSRASGDDVADWLRGIVGVRSRVAALDDALTAGTVFAATPPGRYVVSQQPSVPGRPWVATSSPFGDRNAPVVRSTVVLHADGPAPTQPVAGVIVDSWMEAVPRPAAGRDGPSEIVGVAFHHDRPGARAPQALLVAVAPDLARGWRPEDVHAIVDDTLWMARLRGLDLRDMSGIGDTPPNMTQLLPIPGPM